MTDSEKGVVIVYNEKEELVMKQKSITKEAVLLIEENFLEVVAMILANKKSGDIEGLKKSISGYNPMYA